jgi:hypothetical protein
MASQKGNLKRVGVARVGKSILGNKRKGQNNTGIKNTGKQSVGKKIGNSVVAKHPTKKELALASTLFFHTFHSSYAKTNDCLLVLKNMSVKQIPNLDVVLIGALEKFIRDGVLVLKLPPFKRPLIVGSGNAAVTGQIIAEQLNLDAIFADEGNYLAKLKSISAIDGAILISASGSKHAISISSELKKRKLPVVLLTNNPNAPAMDAIGPQFTHIFAKNREPYTYNTSTYMSMILGASGEDPQKILSYITSTIDPIVSKIAKKKAYMFLVEPKFDLVRPLLYTKFDELFGGVVCGRIFTTEQVKHAKTVVPSRDEFIISFGFDNKVYGFTQNRLTIPLPKWAGPATAMAISYYVVGKIQAAHPGYFKKNIVTYCKDASKIFGQELKPIVE